MAVFQRSGAQGRIRTTDTRIFSPLLYQLSYLGNATREPRQALGLYVIASALSRCASATETGDWGGKIGSHLCHKRGAIGLHHRDAIKW